MEDAIGRAVDGVAARTRPPGSSRSRGRASLSATGRCLLHGLEGAEAGVLINGEGATWAVLEDGDSIEIGGARFRFEAGASGASEEA